MTKYQLKFLSEGKHLKTPERVHLFESQVKEQKIFIYKDYQSHLKVRFEGN